jgi:tetratricopeptide (TPR) repeat protein
MTSPKPGRNGPPRVFISYSHDSRDHIDRVIELAQQLRRDGIDAELDQFHQHELLHWPRWCEEQMRPENSDFVLCICTEEYKRRVEERVEADVGKGVFWEGTLIYSYLYNEKGNRRSVPVLFEGTPVSSIPAILDGYSRFQLSAFDLRDPASGYAGLYRLLTGQEGEAKAGLGEIIGLAPVKDMARQTDFAEVIEKILGRIEGGIGHLTSKTEDILSILKDRPPMASSPARPHNLPPWMAPEYFIGRGEELETLLDGLAAPGGGALAVVQPHVLRGGGGIGKTRLAIQALWVLYLQGGCDMAFFVSASSAAELDMRLAALDGPSLLNLYGKGEVPKDLETRRDNVIHALRRLAGRWVLVIDGADSIETRDAVKRLISELGGGRFIITSRRDDWPGGLVCKMRLDLFTLEEARACLVSRYWKESPSTTELADFDRLAEQLERLPLALSLAASYMNSRRITPGRYLSLWREKQPEILDYNPADVDYAKSLLAAFKMSFDQLSPSASALLSVLAWLAPEPFPRVLVEDSEIVRGFVSAASNNGRDAGDALAELQTLSLVELDEESLRFHRLVLECARAGGAGLRSLESAHSWIKSSLPDTRFSRAGWGAWTQLSPHLDSIIGAAAGNGQQGEDLAVLCNNYGSWLYNQARYASAEPLMRRALQIDEQSLGPNHPNVARDLNNLGQLLRATNRLYEAEPLMCRALQIDEQSSGPDHPIVAIRLNNLAQLLQATNRLSEAEPLIRRALEIDEQSFGPDHPNVASSLNNLAQLLQATNRLSEAEPLMRRALQIDELTFGPDHPEVARDLNNLAQLLQTTNRLSEAEPLMIRALQIDQLTFGQDHPEVARDCNNLGSLYYTQCKYDEAEPLMRRALEIDEQIFGPDHPEVATDLNNLGSLYYTQRKYAEVEPLMRRSLQIDEQSFGPDHPKVAIRLSNLAGLLFTTNRPWEAEPLIRRALQIDEQSFGPDHPKVGADLSNLAQLLSYTDRLSEAEPLYQRSLAILEKAFGKEHPHVITVREDYESLLQVKKK